MPPPSTDRDGFARYLADYPSTLQLWNVGEAGLPSLLAALNVEPVARQRAEAGRMGPHLATLLYHLPHHNQVGIVTAWALRFLVGRPTVGRPPYEEFTRAFDLAGIHWSLKNVMADVYLGTRTFETRGREVRIPYIGNAAFEATDRLFERIEGIQSLPEHPPAEFDRLREWERSEGVDLPWDAIPLEIREELRAFARSIVAQQEAYLDASLDVGGFTMGEAETVLIELYARAWHSALQIMLGSSEPDVVLPAFAPRSLIAQLAVATRIPRERVAAIVELLTTDLEACEDPCLTPLVPLPDGRVTLLSSLMTPGAVVRNFTARLQLDHTRFGEAGRLLGLLGSRTVAETLRRRLTGAKVAERVKVFDKDGRAVGDFDVVAFDPATNEIVVFEVLWRISLDGSADVANLERRAHGKRDQVKQLRAAVDAGASPRWPPGWKVPTDATYHWFIMTPSTLPALVLDDAGVPVRSHKVLDRFRWSGASVADMVEALSNPPPPPLELSATEWVHVRYGHFEVSIERLRA